MQPLADANRRSDIFASTPQPKTATAAPATEPPPPRLTPAEAGLVLSSTIVGARQRVALISGRRYAIGDEVKANKQDGPLVRYKLVAVEPKQIVLESDGDQYVVKLPPRRSPDARRQRRDNAELLMAFAAVPNSARFPRRIAGSATPASGKTHAQHFAHLDAGGLYYGRHCSGRLRGNDRRSKLKRARDAIDRGSGERGIGGNCRSSDSRRETGRRPSKFRRRIECRSGIEFNEL